MDKPLDVLQWERSVLIAKTVRELPSKIKRMIFTYLRDPDTTENTFFPSLGITAGEFAVFHLLEDVKGS